MRRSHLTHLALFTLLAFGLLLGTAAAASASTSAAVEDGSLILESTEPDITAGETTMEGELAPMPNHKPSRITCMNMVDMWVAYMNVANAQWNAGRQSYGDFSHDRAMATLDDYWNFCYFYYGPMQNYIGPGELT